jgi:hypothetical protein
VEAGKLANLTADVLSLGPLCAENTEDEGGLSQKLAVLFAHRVPMDTTRPGRNENNKEIHFEITKQMNACGLQRDIPDIADWTMAWASPVPFRTICIRVQSLSALVVEFWRFSRIHPLLTDCKEFKITIDRDPVHGCVITPGAAGLSRRHC